MKLFKTISLLSICLLASSGPLIAEKHKKKDRTYKQVETCKECRKGKKCKSLVCNADKLAEQLLQPVCSKTTVTRDSLNRPTISGGSFKDLYYTAGYEGARDRLWQFYLLTRVFNGQLATIIGEFGVPNDRAIRSTTYSDDEFLDQFKTFSKVTKIGIKQWLKGINARIQDVRDGKAPLPAEFEANQVLPVKISLAELLRYFYHLQANFSPQASQAAYINKYFEQVENLVNESGYTADEALAIASDLYNSRLLRAQGIIAEDIPTSVIPCKPGHHRKRTTSKKAQPLPSTNNSATMTISEYNKKTRELDEFKAKQGIPSGSSSFALIISGKHTVSGQPIALSGPQSNLIDIPGLFSNGIIHSEELSFQTNNYGFALVPYISGSHGGRNGYIFSTAGQVGSLPGTPSLLEDTTLDIYLRTDVIQVKGGTPVEQPVYASPYGGFVVQRFLTSSLFPGEVKSLVTRNLDFGTDLSFLDPLFLSNFASSIEELEATTRGPGWSTAYGLSLNGIDNQGNIFGAERDGWYDFTTSDVIPQGILNNPIPVGKDLPERRSGVFVANPCSGYVVGWNTPLIQHLPCSYGDGEISRVRWLEEKLTDIISKRKLTSTEANELYTQVANGVAGATFPFTPPAAAYNNYETDYFHSLFKKRFFKAVKAYPTPERKAAVALLRNFDGGFIEGDDLAIATSKDISDKWILAQQWVFEVQAAIVQNTFGNAWSGLLWSSDRAETTGFDYNRNVLALIARLLNVSSVNNPLNYPDWLIDKDTQEPLDVNRVIVEALDRALEFLGGFEAQPWGKDGRPTATYVDAGLGGPIPFTCSEDGVTANRAGIYFTSETTQDYGMDISSINQIGQSGLVLFEVQDGQLVPVVQDDAQMCSYLRFATTPLVTFNGKKVSKKSHIPKHHKQK